MSRDLVADHREQTAASEASRDGSPTPSHVSHQNHQHVPHHKGASHLLNHSHIHHEHHLRHGEGAGAKSSPDPRVISVERPEDRPTSEEPPMTTALAGAKLLAGLHHLSFRTVSIEENSVYGAAILMPQIARSMGYPSFLVAQTVEAYVYLGFCIFLHASILLFICKESEVVNGFAGEMYLCDYGAYATSCPDASPECRGPGGTNYTLTSTYSNYGTWGTRRFVRDSLNLVLPQRLKEVQAAADPGEYGVESNHLRYLCCFIFVVSIMSEFQHVLAMGKLLYHLPTRNEPWVEVNTEAEQTKRVCNWLDEIRVHVRGMSLRWKLLNILLVALPKLCLVLITANFGVAFLMETARINDIIVNVMALGFLLAFDEAITDNLMSSQANYLVENVEPYHLDHKLEAEEMTEQSALKLYNRSSLPEAVLQVVYHKLRSLIVAVLLTWVLVRCYYETHCELVEGNWVSRPVYTPKQMAFDLFTAVFGEVEREETPAWTPT